MADDTPRKTLLVVDDTPENLAVLCELLQPHYEVYVATSGVKALHLANSEPAPDLILLDVMMPDMDGYEVFARLREEPLTRTIPVIFVTAMDSIEAEIKGLALGAVDYVTKPIVPPLVLARIATQLELKSARDQLRQQNTWLEAEVRRRVHENELTKQVAVRALAHLAETRDPETGHHILRTQAYVGLLARRLQSHPRFADQLDDVTIDLLTQSAPLHDIGKVGIPDAILSKPGALDHTEWEIMKTHSHLGAEAIRMAEHDAPETTAFLSTARDIARWHHERWDGSGYPDGLTGEAIPLAARLMAIADVFDALISRRCYKQAFSYDEARRMIVAGRGSHFDPDIVDAFDTAFAECVSIAERYREEASA